ncbi:complex I subunit 4 family protein [Paenibacillus radicis (ex Gao et al. 2016)]|uniref:NADH-quinone oxidoreductase subunit M n=1 Tax=Paenibacillus radicis (ex Gao et al. 2016) TaxID=1737354 RepID=A0A917HP72_9BACL|nr:NADH-quinone oxidoreductase subunit M [Paenibacillus radicis (ex Gao et al. 2016)]GGG84900.1 NADH-quinone oxidoreductase subunit M [Paenibacillus radicis (ex Gao et al. 2016)]
MNILSDWPILSIILATPLAGLLVVLLLPSRRNRWLHAAAIITTLIPLLLSCLLYSDFVNLQGVSGYEEQATWVEVPLNKETLEGVTSYKFIIQYAVGIDGLSLPLVILTALVTAMAAFASIHVKKRWKAFYAWFLLLEAGMLGVFLARDLFLFFISFELTIIAMYFLIGIWGYFNRERAANQFLIYNGIGSAVLLIAFIILVNTAGFRIEQSGNVLDFIYSGNYADLAKNMTDPTAWVNLTSEAMGGLNPFHMGDAMQWTLFVLLMVGFGIKLPIFPFHTWMLKVHTEAPPSIVMIHSGVLLKMGAYGMIRFGIYLFPEQAKAWAVVLAVLGLVNLLYGALIAFRQKDLKQVLAYSSISHMGIFLLGLAAFNEIGLQGAVFQLVSHGLISALLFLLVGSFYERTKTTELPLLGGLARSMPFMSGMLLAGGLAALGLPGLSGFIGELLSLLGLFESHPWLAGLALLGIILTAAYVLRSVLKVTFGPMDEQYAAAKDARLVEAVPMIVLLAVIILLGCYPSMLTDTLHYSYETLIHPILATRAGG